MNRSGLAQTHSLRWRPLLWVGLTLLFHLPFRWAKGELFRLQADAPIHRFKLPMFDEHGNKIWQCWGEQVYYVTERNIRIEQLRIDWFSENAAHEADMVIRSAQAQVSLPECRAEGKPLLTVTNPGYTILGEDWLWEGKNKTRDCARIFIRKNAHVSFYDAP